ncbi:MAG TPA: alpha-D-glucose phosphate-specific phosphoglucomutase [Polyangiaceae bacterium]|nr:alpha-D-glucose phosphate-specific phosphoglucomutase [Polyangiaceae bacterium]
MTAHPLAGKPAPTELLADIPKLVSAYYTLEPDPTEPGQRVAFGTSGHRGSSLDHAFNEAHILATTQAICDHRRSRGIDGPLHLGKDTHALSEPAFRTALEVLAANGVEVRVDADDGYTPTPVISHAILVHNRGRERGLADGIVITPSHNPPEDGGFKYNPPHGGPAGGTVTGAIEEAANGYLRDGLEGVRRVGYARARSAASTRDHDYVRPYVEDLGSVVDLDAVKGAKIAIGVDPLGGAGVGYWGPIAERYGLDLDVVDDRVDPTFSFMTLDRDGKIRMDCSSPHAMQRLVGLKDRYGVAFGNDTDFDRHGIVTRSSGLLNPNHYLAVAIHYLYAHRETWPETMAVGKTLVSSAMIDRVAAELGRELVEVPVGFKWFVEGLSGGRIAFGGEESAGASFVRRDGHVWTTDKDGFILDLLAAEICAVMGKDPGELYAELTARHGEPVYERIEAPATNAQKAVLKKLSPELVTADELAGERILDKLTEAPGNGAAIGGLKVITESGWFAARPSGTEAVYKIYAESFLGRDHLARIQEQAQAIVGDAFAAAGG